MTTHCLEHFCFSHLKLPLIIFIVNVIFAHVAISDKKKSCLSDFFTSEFFIVKVGECANQAKNEVTIVRPTQPI